MLTKYFISIFFVFLSSLACAEKATIAVAANMKPAMEKIYREYQLSGGADLNIVYGGSANLANQIRLGAPFSLFVSADEKWPLALYQNRLTLDKGVVYAIGRLVLVSNKSNHYHLSLDELELIKIINSANKISIAKPEIAPYGEAAVEFLKATSLIEVAKPKLVYGEDVSAATNFVAAGAAEIGFTAYALAISSESSSKLDFVLIPSNMHKAIRQRMVLIKNAPQATMHFYAYMQSQNSRKILQAAGYSLP